MNPLISAAELRALLPGATAPEPRLLVLDATAVLPGQRFDPDRSFDDARIPGARRFDIELFSDPDSDLPHTVPGQARFRRLVGALGLGDDDRVVVYDQTGVASAARAWWLLDLFGHDAVQVLDGGLPAWTAAGGTLQRGRPAPSTDAAVAGFTPRFRAARLAGLGDVLALFRDDASGAVMLDARSRGRFEGTVPEPRAGLPGGHVPGSRSLPFTELLDAEQRFLPPEQLRARFARAGIVDDTRVVTSCGSGLTAAVLTLGLVRCGLPRGALFDGSWTEWARSGAPRATGPDHPPRHGIADPGAGPGAEAGAAAVAVPA